MADDEFKDTPLDDHESDINWNFDDDFDLDSPTNNKKELFKEAVSDSWKGFKESVSEVVGNEMPRTRMALSEIQDTLNDLKTMRDDLSREVGPTIESLKKASLTILPGVKKLMPKKMYNALEEKIKSSIKETPESEAAYKKRQREGEIQSGLSGLSGSDVDKAAAEDTKERITDRAVNALQHRGSMKMFGSLLRESQFQSKFMSTSLMAYMKKSLELKYKHYFVAQDTLATVTAMGVRNEQLLNKIVNNTAISDIRKEEYYRKSLRKNNTRLSEFTTAYRAQLMKNIKENWIDPHLQSIQMLGMGAGMMDTVGGLGGGGSFLRSMLFNTAGGILGRIFSKPIFRRFKPLIGSIEAGTNNLQQRLMLGLSELGDKLQDKPGWNWLASILPKFNKSTLITNSLEAKADQPVPFDNLTRQSIVEIIPGFLGKIHKRITDISLSVVPRDKDGNQLYNTEEEVYDFYKRDFVKASEFVNSVKSKVINVGAVKNTVSDAIGTVRSVFTESDAFKKISFNKVEPDLRKFVINSGLNTITLRPEIIKSFFESLNSEDDGLTIDELQNKYYTIPDYIKTTFDTTANPYALACVLKSILYKNNTLDIDVKNQLNDAIIDLMNVDEFRTKLPEIIDNRGYGRFLRSYTKNTSGIATTVDLRSIANARESFTENLSKKDIKRTSEWIKRDIDEIRENRAIAQEWTGGSSVFEEGSWLAKIANSGIPILENLPYIIPSGNIRDKLNKQSQNRKPMTKEELVDLIKSEPGMWKQTIMAQPVQTAKAVETLVNNKLENIGDNILDKAIGKQETGRISEKTLAESIDSVNVKLDNVKNKIIKTFDNAKTNVKLNNVKNKVIKTFDSVKDHADSIIPKILNKLSVKADSNLVNELKDSLPSWAWRHPKLIYELSVHPDKYYIMDNETGMYHKVNQEAIAQLINEYRPNTPVKNNTNSTNTKNFLSDVRNKLPNLRKNTSDYVTLPSNDKSDSTSDTNVRKSLGTITISEKALAAIKKREEQIALKSIDKEIKDNISSNIKEQKDETSQSTDGSLKNFVEYYKYRQQIDSAILSYLESINTSIGSGFEHVKPGYFGRFGSHVLKALSLSGKALGIGGLGLLHFMGQAYKGLAIGAGHVLKGTLNLGAAALPHVMPFLNTVLGGGARIAAGGLSLLGNILNPFAAIIPGITNFTKNTKRRLGPRFFDVWVKDEVKLGEPLLSAKQQEEGVFYTNGEPVLRTMDIYLPVVDKDGNVLVTKEQLREGLVDIHNKPIRYQKVDHTKHSVMSNLTESVRNLTGGAKALVTNATKAGASLAKNAGDVAAHGAKQLTDFYFGLLNKAVGGGAKVASGLGTIVGRAFGLNVGGGIGKKGIVSITDRLDTIINILKYAHPGFDSGKTDIDNDGIRDGSAEDIQKQKEEKKRFAKLEEIKSKLKELLHRNKNNKTEVSSDINSKSDSEDEISDSDILSDISTRLFKKTKLGRRLRGFGRLFKKTKGIKGKTALLTKSVKGLFKGRKSKLSPSLLRPKRIGASLKKGLSSINKFGANAFSKISKVGTGIFSKSKKLGTMGKLAGKTLGKNITKGLLLKGGLKAAGRLGGQALKFIPGLGLIATAGMGVIDGISGWRNAGQNLGIAEEDLTFGDKVSGALGGIASGLTFGLLGQDTATKGAHWLSRKLGFSDDLSPEERVRLEAEAANGNEEAKRILESKKGGFLNGLQTITGINAVKKGIGWLGNKLGFSGSSLSEKERIELDKQAANGNEEAKQKLSSTKGSIKKGITNLFKNSLLSKTISTTKSLFNQAKEKSTSLLNKVPGAIDVATNAAKTTRSFIADKVNGIPSSVTNTWNKLQEKIPTVPNPLTSLKRAANTAKDKLSNIKLPNLLNKGTLSPEFNQLLNVTNQQITTLTSIETRVSELVTYAQQIADNTKSIKDIVSAVNSIIDKVGGTPIVNTTTSTNATPTNTMTPAIDINK